MVDDMEEEMKVRTNNNGMKQLEKLGFKKIKTEPGFHMYELTPARAAGPAAGDARSEKRPSAQANKRTSNTKAFGRHQAHKLDK